MASDILSFTGKYRWLSNFYPIFVTLDGEMYPSVEHAYQAAKANPKEREPFKGGSAGDAKRLGREVNFDAEYWDSKKLTVMKELLRQKFENHSLRHSLLATGDSKIVEGNYWNDTFWGVCRGTGKNHLGRLIMEVREELRAGA